MYGRGIVSDAGRTFAGYPVALQAVVVDNEERVLLLANPVAANATLWQVVSGGMEADESVLDGTLREVREELGAQVRVRPLGVIHAHTFRYDSSIPRMIGIYYLLAYEGGEIVPGDDMAGSELAWVTVAEAERLPLHASTPLWILERALETFAMLNANAAIDTGNTAENAPGSPWETGQE
jgi:ADP-ribose pyrophosphatase YjhB (NUDIX family)